MRRLLGFFAALLLASTLSAQAGDGDWVIAKASGEIFLQTGGAQFVAVPGAGGRLTPGSVLLTSGNGRVMLVRGKETMLVSPNSIIGLPKGASGQITTIIERSGEVEFEVEKGNVQHFAVETPYLAAIVKGTRFTVKVTDGTATVSVSRGRVEVDALAAGQSVDIVPGQSATVTAGGLTVRGGGPRAPIVPIAPRRPLTKPYNGVLDAANPLGADLGATTINAAFTLTTPPATSTVLAPGGTAAPSLAAALPGGNSGPGNGNGLGGGLGNGGNNSGNGNGGQDNGLGTGNGNNGGGQGSGNEGQGGGQGGGNEGHGGGRGNSH